MVVKEDGSKWACQSCLKGHRVSGCNHVDRELTLVPKKGRPVTQCQHCRQERKKRSAHVSCDCGTAEKLHHSKEKCIHLREAEERAKAAGYHHDDHIDKDPAHLARIAEEQGCCCGHGGTCTCALLMNEPDDTPNAPHGPAVKPKLEKTISEGSITVFQNGHHKPVHRKNHAAHECGMPYKIPMPRHHTEQSLATTARRSVDSLPLETNQPFQPSSLMPLTYTTERRLSKSEEPSPKPTPLSETGSGLGDAKLANSDFGTLSQTQTNQSIQSATSESFGFPSYDPMSGVSSDPFDAWPILSSADSVNMPNNNFFGVWPTSTDNMNMVQPALTAASSGTTSEIDEVPPVDDAFDFAMPSIQEDPNFDLSASASGNSPQSNRRSLPPGFFGNIDFAIPGMGNEWQMSDGVYNAANASSKFQMQQNRQTSSFDEAAWQMSDVRPITNVAQRQLNGLPSGSRPQSRSVGPGSAPNDDVIKQLFPGIDVNGTMFNPVSNLATSSPGLRKNMGGLPMSNPTSAPVDFGPMDETSSSFTSQPWSDGSFTIPSDVITSSYNLNQDFSNPDFTTNNWQ